MLGIDKDLISDTTDIRDMMYSPALVSLEPELFPEQLLLDTDSPRIAVGNQADTEYCTGFALAAIIDIQRATMLLNRAARSQQAGTSARSVHPEPWEFQPVSARMLFEMGRLISARCTGSGSHRYSIRSTLKGFYHNGVCLRKDWDDNDRVNYLTVERAKSAKQISLGAYYRLRHFLSDYHGALAESGAILVSAMLHSGWQKPPLSVSSGIIKRADETGAHAFVIIGYNQDGFLVLNSWGPDWYGPFSLDGQTRTCPGIALWRYEDWADNVIDAWVLRLAVPTPLSFEHSVGSQGRRFGYLAGGSVSQRRNSGDESPQGKDGLEVAPSRKTVLGHYVHMERGKFVQNGSYPDSRTSLKNTLNYLDRRYSNTLASVGKKPPEHIYLRIIGDSGSTKDAMHRVSSLKRRLRDRNIYPLTFIWSAELANAFAISIGACMQEAIKQIPEPSDERDDLIELAVRAIGVPLWAQMDRDAECVAKANGPLELVFARLNDILDRRHPAPAKGSGKIDLTFELAGALVFVAWMTRLGTRAIDELRHVRHIHLVMPMVESLRLARSIRSVVPDSCREAADFLSRLKLYFPTESYLKHSSIAYYQRTWFELVNNSFMPDNLGEKSREMVSLFPDEFLERVHHFWPDARYDRTGIEMTRQEDRSADLRWSLVEDRFLDGLFDDRTSSS